MNTTIWIAYNPLTRRHEQVDLDEAELLPGQTVLRMFWCASARQYVTVPGASLYVVNVDGDPTLQA